MANGTEANTNRNSNTPTLVVSQRLHDACIVIEDEAYETVSPSLRQELHANVLRLSAMADDRLASPTIYIGRKVPVASSSGPLIWFHATSAGVDHLLRDPLLTPDVLLTRTVGRMGERIAEYVMCRMILEAQRIETFLQQQKDRLWRQHAPRRITESQVLVFGSGRMGRSIAALLNQLDVSVDAVATAPRILEPFRRVMTLETALPDLPRYDWLVAALPLTTHTKALIGAEVLARCDEACFVNVGRAGTVDIAALAEALRTGRLKKAYLDVFPEEPLASSSPWWDDERVHVTPHIAALTDPSDVITDFIAAWRTIQHGRPPSCLVNPARGY
ncbi:MAG: D-2-hydroxyacid dehydrogenase [Actinobacteria bacterium]|nr:D-2-hydroxyacid dehydrogenase [Actinomycetota bacterium]